MTLYSSQRPSSHPPPSVPVSVDEVQTEAEATDKDTTMVSTTSHRSAVYLPINQPPIIEETAPVLIKTADGAVHLQTEGQVADHEATDQDETMVRTILIFNYYCKFLHRSASHLPCI